MAPERKFRPQKAAKVAFAVADENDTNGNAKGDLLEKDETEEELERLIFGDSEGFHSALKEHDDSRDLVLAAGSGSEDELGDGNASEDDLAGVADADLFYLDAGDSVPLAVMPEDGQPAGELDSFAESGIPAAWEDSDDDRIRVSLADNERLRKLRLTEAEDVISGREYIVRLRRQFERLQPAPEWANPAPKRRRTDAEDMSDQSMDYADSDEEDSMTAQPLAKLLQNIGDLTRDVSTDAATGKRKLRQGVLDVQRSKDVGGNQPSSIDSLSFHPHYPLLLSSGPASTLFLHHISPEAASPNPLLTSLHIRRTPLRTSAFAPPTGNRILCSGRRRYFHVWNLDTGKIEKINGPADRKHELRSMEHFKVSPCGRWIGFEGTTKKGGGVIIVLDATTMQWTAQVRIDSRGGVADFAWWRDGEGMCVVGKNGEVSEWDRREKRIISRWVDEGAVGTTILSLGGQTGRQELGGDRWVAIGSSSGIVNIYDRKPWADAAALASRGKSSQSVKEAADVQFGIPQRPKPTRMLDQLTTPTSHLVFSSDGQFLVMASRWKRDALRLSNTALSPLAPYSP
ncbi:small nucleolar ribonucleoprotein complex subunit [Arthroderma uncinatum]|uniref:small nucleolar ribonucleoprotein complex subunit n=1 Tax=Arthroderma uncinatum TaxID=74035 RepID=UPI00144A8683|nr:small nucleolar ribonucleoprotein complex subunit [Arthroderma uncinatum]KAF3480315.1 small nucleolar ribonucleoprotein complex subunit [Arthroderma uncinatum]